MCYVVLNTWTHFGGGTHRPQHHSASLQGRSINQALNRWKGAESDQMIDSTSDIQHFVFIQFDCLKGVGSDFPYTEDQ